MTVRELLGETRGEPEGWRLHVNAFVDDFRRAGDRERAAMIAERLEASGRMEGLIAATVSALCRETGVPAPGWARDSQPGAILRPAGDRLRAEGAADGRVAGPASHPKRVRAGDVLVPCMKRKTERRSNL